MGSYRFNNGSNIYVFFTGSRQFPKYKWRFYKKILSLSNKFNSLTELEQQNIIVNVQYYVRKAAHFSVFASLGLCLFSAINLTFKNRFLWLYSFIVSVLYAISDEIHQLFVLGRSCRIGDMFIDSMGALSGILIVLIIITLYKYQKIKKAVQNWTAFSFINFFLIRLQNFQ